MIRPSEHNNNSSDGKLPWWAFPLAAVALVLAPAERGDGRQVARRTRVYTRRERSEGCSGRTLQPN
jgi:hypothetical protein